MLWWETKNYDEGREEQQREIRNPCEKIIRGNISIWGCFEVTQGIFTQHLGGSLPAKVHRFVTTGLEPVHYFQLCRWCFYILIQAEGCAVQVIPPISRLQSLISKPSHNIKSLSKQHTSASPDSTSLTYAGRLIPKCRVDIPIGPKVMHCQWRQNILERILMGRFSTSSAIDNFSCHPR